MARDLTTLIGSRICHDLISPIGAVGNGMELLAMSGQPDTPELALIRSSVETAMLRLRLFRLAFGRPGGTQMVARTELDMALRSLEREGRNAVDWGVGDRVSRGEVQALLLALMCCDNALPRGGRLTARTLEDGSYQVSGAGDQVQVDSRLWRHLSAPDAGTEIGAGEVHFALLADMAAQMRRPLTVHTTPSAVRLTF